MPSQGTVWEGGRGDVVGQVVWLALLFVKGFTLLYLSHFCVIYYLVSVVQLSHTHPLTHRISVNLMY